MEEILTPNEVANRLKVHLMTVYRWISSGWLEASRLPGGGLRIDAKDIEKLLNRTARGSRVSRRKNSARSRK